MATQSSIDSNLKLESVVDTVHVKVEETDSNNSEFSPWISQETPEVISIDQAMDDGCHRCNICFYNARCKCDLTRHMFWHRDPQDLNTFKYPFCKYEIEETYSNFEAHLLSHQNLPHEKFKCCICDVEYLNKNDLASHILKYKDLNNLIWFKCDFCNYKSKYLGSFRSHYIIHKDSSEELTCFICNYKCETKMDLEKHMLLHKDAEDVDLFKCYLCDQKTERLEDLKMHLFTHLSGSDCKIYCVCHSVYKHPKKQLKKKSVNYQKIEGKKKCFQCTHCDAKYRSKFSLKLHMQNHADSSEMIIYDCDHCDYKSKYKYFMKKHKLKHQLADCSVCDIKMNKLDLEEHNKIFHSDSTNNTNTIFKCCMCNSKCETRTDLAKHLLIHKNVDNTCKICGCRIKKEISWISHMLMHSNVDARKTNKCKQCPYITTSLTNLERHKEKHKDRFERHLFKCPECNAEYTRKESLHFHMKDHAGKAEQLLLHCDECDYKTKFKSMFNKHKLKHQLLMCSSCNLTVSRFELKEHNEVLHSESAKDSNVVLECCICDYKCHSKSDLVKHLLIHKDSNMCSICNFINKNESSWVFHMLIHSNVDIRKSYKCDQCAYSTMISQNIERHKETHKDRSKRKLFRCADCNAEYTTKHSLRLHLQDHADEGDAEELLHHCDQCDYKTKYRYIMRNHKLSHQLMMCSFCNLTMSGLDLKKHNETFHSDSSKHANNVLECCVCVYKCEGKSDLAQHLLIHKDINNVCNICGFKNSNESSWVSHMLIHSNVKLTKRLKCDQCAYSTVNSTSLERHKETHKDLSERNLFECTHCDAKFTNKTSLKLHVQEHGDPLEVVTYNCDHCDYMTKKKSVYTKHKLSHQLGSCSSCDMKISALDLKEHNKIFHSDDMNNSNAVLICCICSCKYETKSELARHLLTHKDSKNTCSLCRYAIKKDMSWVTHMLIHSNVNSTKCHRCNECPYFTTNLKNLERHKKKHKNYSERTFFRCEGCDTKFIAKASLSIHIQDHMDQRDSEQSCDQCDYKTKFGCGMKNHKLSHQLAMCSSCNLTMSGLDLKEHNEIFHSGSSKYSSNIWKCSVCDFTCETKSQLVQHLFIHKDINNICNICGFKNKTESSWVSHMIFHSNLNVTKRHKCDQCAYSTINSRNLQRHKETHKDRSERVFFKCLLCNAKFRTKYSLKTHSLYHADNSVASEGGLYRCDECDYKCKFRHILTKHKLKHQLGRCSVCNLEVSELDLEAHNKIFHSEVSSDSNEFKCCVCLAKCETQGDLAKHLLLHKDVKNACSICGCATKTELSWLSHMFIHSNIGLRRSYKCEQCFYCTTSAAHLKRHKETHKDRSERKLFKCSHCDTKYTTKQSLKLHMKDHECSSDGTMHHCDHCDYKTKYNYAIKKHKLKHEEIKCSVCHLYLKTQAELKEHVERSHPECMKVVGVLQCGICDNRCETREGLVKHFLLHKDPTRCNVFKCDTCEYESRYLNDLRLHKKRGKCLEDANGTVVPDIKVIAV